MVNFRCSYVSTLLVNAKQGKSVAKSHNSHIFLNILIVHLRLWSFVIFRDILFGRWAGMAITLCSLLLILVATLNPYNFNFNETFSNFDDSFIILGPGKYDTRDIIQNILLFLPLGFSLTVYLMQTMRLGALTSLFVTILI